jgi:hypothetical protein
VFGAECRVRSCEWGIEHGEGGGLGEVTQDALVGNGDGERGFHRFFPTTTFFGADWPKVSR